jgi:predicted aspartyl protease
VRTNAFIGPNDQSLREIRFLVDSGSFYTVLPPALAAELGIAAALIAPAILGDSRVVQLRHGVAYLRIEDREGAVQVGVLDVPEPIMGVSALEALGFKIAPIRERLEMDRPYGPAIL